MQLIYNILTIIVDLVLFFFGFFNRKLKKRLVGVGSTFRVLKKNIKNNDQVIWLHCASLGEYEQGLPVFENLKLIFPNHKFVISFFSASGYEVKIQNPITDLVVYLPSDHPSKVNRFLNLLNPELVVFVKYDLWPNYLSELKKRKIRAILISALFRKNQIYFKPYGSWFLDKIKTFEQVFVQNEASKILLEKYGIINVTNAGDTRFDRVNAQLQINNQLDFIENFKGKKTCIVAGSTWPEDEELIVQYINNSSDNLKFIIAPHNVDHARVKSLKEKISEPIVQFTADKNTSAQLKNAKVYILDTIGLLSKVYAYADIAYVGGGMGKSGLHNTLEAATFGLPIIIGKNYKKFPEAIAMISKGSMSSVATKTEFQNCMDSLLEADFRKLGELNRVFVEQQKGATKTIMAYLINFA